MNNRAIDYQFALWLKLNTNYNSQVRNLWWLAGQLDDIKESKK